MRKQTKKKFSVKRRLPFDALELTWFVDPKNGDDEKGDGSFENPVRRGRKVRGRQTSRGEFVTTLLEHAKRLEEMKAAEKRIRDRLAEPVARKVWTVLGPEDQIHSDVRLLLERLDSYESSITWHTNCHTCPKLYDQIYEMDQYTIPKFRALLKRVLDDARISGADQVSDATRKDIRDALVSHEVVIDRPSEGAPLQPTGASLETKEETLRFARNTYKWIADKCHCLDPDGLKEEIVTRLFEVFRGYIRHGQAVHAASVEKLLKSKAQP